MQLFTASPSSVHGAGAAVAGVAADVRAGEVEVVADEVDEQRATRRRRARSVVPLISTVTVRLVVGRAHDSPFALLGGLQHGPDRRAPRRDGGGSRPSAWTSDGGSSDAPRPSAAARTRASEQSPAASAPSIAVARTGHDETQPSAITHAVGAHRRRRVDDVRAVRAERDPGHRVAGPRRRAAARRSRVSSSPSADRRHVDADEELLGRHRALAARRRGSSSSRPSATSSGGRWFVGSFDADVAADRAAVPHLDVGDRRRDLGEHRPRHVDLARTDELRVGDHRAELERRARRPRRRSCGARRDRPGRRARRARRPAAFITLTSVWPPARARAPSCSARRPIASSTVAGRAYSTSRRSMASRSHTSP